MKFVLIIAFKLSDVGCGLIIVLVIFVSEESMNRSVAIILNKNGLLISLFYIAIYKTSS